MKKIIPIIVAIAFALIAYSGGLDKISEKVEGLTSNGPEYTQVKKGGPEPKKLFGLTNSGGGVWKDSSGKVVYRQAREYQGGSKSQPLEVKKDGSCQYQKNPVEVEIDSEKYPASALHIYLGIRAGVPEILHINRDPGYDIRLNSLEGIESNSTFDRDEVPFALSNEAAVYNKNSGTSDIAFIPFSDNRGSGSSMGGQLSEFCEGQPFQIKIK